MEKDLEKLLLSVQCPARYIGGEINTPNIDENARVKFCMLSPELYEVGMTDIKFLTIYHKVNDRKGNSCERCFAPWLDMASALKKNNKRLFSLENKKPLHEFDLLGASLSYQTDFTTLLYMLDLGGITLQADKRHENEPLVFGMGAATLNPEVVASFLDFIIVGDAEEVILPVLECLRSAKTNKFSRSQTLHELAKLQSVYVPSLNYIEYDKKGNAKGFSMPAVKKAVSMDLDRTYFPTNLQIPNIKTVRECVKIEPIRGCTKGCRFCQYSFVSRPIRTRRVANLSSAAMTGVTTTGFSKIDFVSKCVGEYPKLSALLPELDAIAVEKKANYLLPSFEGSQCYTDFVRLETKDTIGLTIEAGSLALRNKINKDLSDDRIEEALVKAYRAGYSCIKMYFMIGLPFETGADLLGIIETVKRAKALYRKYKTGSKPLYLSCVISNFIPKPFTPFAWCESISIKEAEKRFRFIKKGLRGLSVRSIFYSPEYSQVEAILSRGGRRISDAVILAYKYGSVFDRNKQLFNFKAYQKAFDDLNICIEHELARRDTSLVLPWDNVDILVDKCWLLQEFDNAKNGKVTPDCRTGCKACGLSRAGVCKHGNL